MAVDMFMKLDKIPGESEDATHKGEIDVLAWSWGMSQSGTFHAGSGGGAGKVNVQDLSFTKWVDKATPLLMLYTSNGDVLKESTLVVRKAGKVPLEYIKIKMTKCMVTSVSTGGSSGEERLTENVTLNFAEVVYTYAPQKVDGTGDTPIEYKWNIAGNVQL